MPAVCQMRCARAIQALTSWRAQLTASTSLLAPNLEPK